MRYGFVFMLVIGCGGDDTVGGSSGGTDGSGGSGGSVTGTGGSTDSTADASTGASTDASTSGTCTGAGGSGGTGTGGSDIDPFAPRRIWTIGDSITGGTVTYRTTLWQRVTGAGIPLDMLGSHEMGPAELPDRDTDGYGGYRIDEWAVGLDAYATAAVDPTDVLGLLGTNDMANGDGVWGTTAEAPDRLQALVLDIQAYHPTARYWIGTLPPSTSLTVGPRIDLYNPALPGVAVSVGATLVDIHAALTPADIGPDKIHPTPGGYIEIGNTWADALGMP